MLQRTSVGYSVRCYINGIVHLEGLEPNTLYYDVILIIKNHSILLLYETFSLPRFYKFSAEGEGHLSGKQASASPKNGS